MELAPIYKRVIGLTYIRPKSVPARFPSNPMELLRWNTANLAVLNVIAGCWPLGRDLSALKWWSWKARASTGKVPMQRWSASAFMPGWSMPGMSKPSLAAKPMWPTRNGLRHWQGPACCAPHSFPRAYSLPASDRPATAKAWRHAFVREKQVAQVTGRRRHSP